MRRLSSFIIRIAISALLLYLSLQWVNFKNISQRLGELDQRWIAFSLLIMCSQMPLLALRWRGVARICGAEMSFVTSLRYTLIGVFFSQVLPSTIGGDAARIWLLARDKVRLPAAIYSVMIDRVIGVFALSALVVVCLPWTLNLVHNSIARATLMLIGFGTLGVVLIFLVLGTHHLHLMERWWFTRHLATASRFAWKLCPSAAGARILILSFIIHLQTVTTAWGAAMAAHATVNFAQVLFLVLPVMLIATIPISISGWGVRESAMVLAFSYADLIRSDGLIISILFGAGIFVIGIIGGVVWIAGAYGTHHKAGFPHSSTG